MKLALEPSAEFDLVFMDVQMPIMDGLEATRQIRRGGSNVPVIALTANADEGTKSEAIEAGMEGILTKPINIEDLKLLLGRLRRRKSRSFLKS